MSNTFRLLVVEDRVEDAELLVAGLVRAGFSPEWERVDTRERLLDALDPVPALILCDYNLPGFDALQVLSTVKDLELDVPVIVVSGEMDEETCVKSLRMGAVDYLLKDRLARLGPAVDHALAIRRLSIEKTEAERKSQETTSILRGLVTHSPAAISVKAVDGRYLWVNHPFERLHGATPGSLIGRIDADVLPAELARETTELDARCLHTSMVLEREVTLGEGDDARHLVSVRYPVTNETGVVTGIGSISMDVTRQKNTEAELRKTRAEAMHLNHRLVAGNERLAAGNDHLRELDRLKTEFIASVSHELRTPLTSIRGYLEMLRDPSATLPTEMQHRFLAIIDRNSEHLLSLIEDLLILSKMDSGQYAALDREIDLAHVVEMAASMLGPAVQQAGIVLVTDLDEELPRVLGDGEQLERVVINLLSNAIKFSEPGQRVVIRGRRQGSMVNLSVKDDGIGIAVEDQHKLFTRFFRTTAAKDRGIPGTGLGLAVVKGIVDGHGGTLQVDSELGRGTTMSVLLAAAPQEHADRLPAPSTGHR